MAASKELVTKIVLKATADGSISKAFSALSKNSDTCISKLSKIGKTASTAFKTVAGAVAAGAVAAGKAAIDFESAFAGVQKTVEETNTTSYEDLSKGIRNLAKTTPAAATEIAEVAAAAGQLGIKADDVLSFSKTMIDLGESTNLTSDEAATSIAKLFNITGTSMNQVSNFGATLVALGNNAATTESDILAMTMRLAGSGKLIGLTEQQTLALATSLSSVGIEAEAGGTAMSNTMTMIDKAVATNSEELAIWAKTAGMSAKEFKVAWKNDAYGSLQQVMQGMAKTTSEGGNLNLLLEELGINGIRQGDTLKRLANATSLMGDMTNLANKSWEENAALSKEANTRYATTAARIQILRNKINDVSITVGTAMLPVINKIIDKMDDIDWDAKADKLVSKVQWVIDNFDKLKVALGILAGAFATFKIASFITTVAGAVKELKLLAQALKLSERINQMTLAFKKALVVGRLTAQLKMFNAQLKVQAVKDYFASLKNTAVLQSCISAFNKFKTALSSFSITQTLATAKQWLFNTSLYGCPIVWIIAGIAALIAIIVLLVKNWDKVKEACVKCWDGIKNAVAKVGAWLKNFFTTTLPNAFNAVITWFKELPSKIWGFLTGVWNKISTWGANLGAKAKEIGSNFVNKFVTFFKELPYKLGYLIGYAIGLIVKLFAKLVIDVYQVGYRIGYAIGTWFVKLWTFATTEIPKFIGKVVSWFKQLPGKIWTWLVNVVTRLTQWGVNVYNKMKTAVVNAINATVNFFKTLPSKIWTWLVNTITKIGQWATNMYAKMKSAAVKAVTATVNFFKTLPSKIWHFLTVTIPKIGAWGMQMLSKMRTAAVNAINAVITWFRQLPSKIWTWLLNTIAKVASWGSQMVAKAKAAAKNLVTGVVNIFKSLPSKMLTIGKSIVQGVWKGISGAGKWLWGKIKDFASGIVDGFKDAIKPGSPSKVMTKLFKCVPQGIGKGITNNARYATNAVDSLGRELVGKASKITPTIGGVSAKLQKFGTGGTITSPQAAIVGDRPETIVPHGNTPRNRALLSEAAKGVGATVGGNTFSFTFAPVINSGNVEENRAMIRDEEAEFERQMNAWIAKNRRLAYGI